MGETQSIWTEAERRAFAPLEKLTPSQWTEKYRVLPNSVAAEAGQIRLARTPYIVGIMDAICEPGVEEVVCLKSTQIGWSTLLESLVGYVVDNEPGPMLLVMDSQKTAQEVTDERIRPLIEHTPAVARHLSPSPHDNTLTSTKFDTCSLFMAWAGSPGTLARRAIRYAFFDEVDKYPASVNNEADPISLGTERTSTYGYRRRVLIGSTPTTRAGAIWRAWESSGDKRKFYVPCPHCNEFQTLVFSQIKWPQLAIEDRAVKADTIELQALAYYECLHCHQPIKESHRPKMLAHGVWLSEGQNISATGTITGTRPKAKRVGFWINAIYSPWRSFSAIAAEFQRAQGNPGRMQNFRNSWLAECWEEIVKASTVDDFRKLLVGAPPANVVPSWAEYIIAGADVQKDRLYWTIRAWGADYKSQLITYGLALSFEELRQHVLLTQFTLESGGTARAHALFIDSGYRTDEVYAFAKMDERIKPVKGGNDTQAMLWQYSTAGKQQGVPLYKLNTQMLKDRLSTLRNDEGRWLLNDKTSDEYLQHLASEQKQIVEGVERWEQKTVGAANHYLDTEVYSLAGAEILRVDLLKPQEQEAAPEQPAIQEQSQTPHDAFVGRKKTTSFLGSHTNWLGK